MNYQVLTNKTCLNLLTTNMSKEDKALTLNDWRENIIMSSNISIDKRIAILNIIEHYLKVLFTTKGI